MLSGCCKNHHVLVVDVQPTLLAEFFSMDGKAFCDCLPNFMETENEQNR